MLDVGDVIEEVKTRLVARGLTILENVPVPQVDKQIVLLTSPQLQQAKTIYAFTNPVATWLIWVVVLLYLGAFLLARRRPRMAVAIGVSLAANALLLAFLLSVGRQLFVNELSGTIWGPASDAFWDTLLSYLVRAWQVLLWLGVVIVVGGWFAGRNASGTACRGFVAGALESAGQARSAPRRWAGPGAGSPATPGGCAGSPWRSVSWCCSGAPTSTRTGCSGRCCSCWCCWWRSRSSSGRDPRRPAPTRPRRDSHTVAADAADTAIDDTPKPATVTAGAGPDHRHRGAAASEEDGGGAGR